MFVIVGKGYVQNRDRKEYQRQYRVKRKLKGRLVPCGSAYQKKES